LIQHAVIPALSSPSSGRDHIFGESGKETDRTDRDRERAKDELRQRDRQRQKDELNMQDL
jgi:hypothetical protein